MTRLLAIGAPEIILIVLIALIVIAYPILVTRRNKKEKQKLTEQTNSLKRGDKVLTTSGIYGTIVDLHLDGDKQIVTIETGTGKNKGYMSIDAYAIYTVFVDEEKQDKPEEKKEEKPEAKPEEKPEEKQETAAQEKPEEKVEEKKKSKKDKKSLDK